MLADIKSLGDRILILGCAGSGKTSLSLKLAKITGLPLIHLDRYYWKKGWSRTPDDLWIKTVSKLCHQEKWIMDGVYTKTVPERVKYATSVIYLDIQRSFRIYSSSKVSVQQYTTHRKILVVANCYSNTVIIK